MGTTLRLFFEEGAKESRGKQALVCLCRHASKLDRICRKLDLKQLSDFHDDSGTGLSQELPGGVTETIKIMIRSKPWFSVADGLATLGPLLRWLEQNPTRFGLLSDDYRGVMDELRHCVEQLEAHPDESCRFNLCVVLPAKAG
jgi:hypothetical protein